MSQLSESCVFHAWLRSRIFYLNQGGIIMKDYKKPYLKLMNEISDSIEKLKKAQIDVEEMLLSMEDEREIEIEE